MSENETTPEFHRIEPRYRLNSGVEVRVLVQAQGSPEPVDAQLVDMSNSGLQLRLSTCLKFDESMAVHILAGDLQFDLAATVKWLRQADEQSWFIGCHIKPELSEDALKRLASMGLLDRRESLRKEVEVPASICGELEATKTPAVIRNLSEDGFGLSTQISRVVGQRIRVAVATNYGETIEITARVIWQIKTQGGFFCGCAFLNRESHSLLNDLIGNDQGALARRRRYGRTTRRTSMWVALAALVVFVFPSAIVLLMGEQSTPTNGVESHEAIATASASAPEETSRPAASSESQAGPIESPLVEQAPVEQAPVDATSEQPRIESPPAGEGAAHLTNGEPIDDPSLVSESNSNITDTTTGAADEGNAIDIDSSPPHATEPILAETSFTEASPGIPPVDPHFAQAEPSRRLELHLDSWLDRIVNRAYDVDKAMQTAADLASADPATQPPAEAVTSDPAQTPDSALPASAPVDEYRMWVDSSGDYRVVARLISVEAGVARLRKKNGRYASVPVDRLSKEDAEFINRWFAAPRQ